MWKKKIGNLGEQIAKKYYQNIGYKVLKQNYYTRYGEIDLVLEKNRQILVVEVKTRTNHRFGWAEESINDKKIDNINHTYYILCSKEGLSSDYTLEICIIEINGSIATLKRLIPC